MSARGSRRKLRTELGDSLPEAVRPQPLVAWNGTAVVIPPLQALNTASAAALTYCSRGLNRDIFTP